MRSVSGFSGKPGVAVLPTWRPCIRTSPPIADTALAPNTTYTYRVVAFNTFGDSISSNTASATTGDFPAATGVTLVSNPISPQRIGTLVNWVAAASGGTGTYEYQFSFRPAGVATWTVAQGYGPNRTWVWDTTTAAAGTNYIRVDARSVGTSTAVSATATYMLKGGTGPATNVALDSTPASPQFPGVPVTWTATASGGSGDYEYKIQLYSPATGAWSTVKEYTVPGNTWAWDTTGLATGTYIVNVWARSAGSTALFEAYLGVYYVLNSPASAVTLTPSVSGPAGVGTPVTWVAAASGGTGNYEYKIQLYSPATGAWSTVKEYTVPGDSWAWDTTGLDPGTYIVNVWARNAGSAAMFEASLSVYYVLSSPLTVTLTPSVSGPAGVGTPVTWTASAGGGSGSYEYKIQLYSPATGAWSTVKEYTVSGDSWAWDTTGLDPGTYIANVWARNAGSSAMYEAYLSVYYILQ